LLTELVQEVALDIVDVEVVEQAIEKHGKDRIVVPLHDELK